jgi:hypothetical protein
MPLPDRDIRMGSLLVYKISRMKQQDELLA